MNIYFLGTLSNNYLILDTLVSNNKIKGLISLDSEAGVLVGEYYDYSDYCNDRGIENIRLKSYSMKAEADIIALNSLDIDILLVMGWQRLVPEWLINKCKVGVIGAHGSPWGIVEGRGRSPQNWALISGAKKFSISIFWIDEGADSGKIIDTKLFGYQETDTIETSYIKSDILIAQMLTEFLNKENIEKDGTSQIGKPYYLPQRIAEDGAIDWNRSGKDIYNFIRALGKPYPGAFSKYKDSKIYIWHSNILNLKWSDDSSINGEVINVLQDGKLLIKCKDAIIFADEYEIKGNDKIIKGSVLDSVSFAEQMRVIFDRHYAKSNNEINPHLIEMEFDSNELLY